MRGGLFRRLVVRRPGGGRGSAPPDPGVQRRTGLPGPDGPGPAVQSRPGGRPHAVLHRGKRRTDPGLARRRPRRRLPTTARRGRHRRVGPAVHALVQGPSARSGPGRQGVAAGRTDEGPPGTPELPGTRGE